MAAATHIKLSSSRFSPMMHSLAYIMLLAVASGVVLSQAPNPLYPAYPNLATSSFNQTVFILPLDSDVAQMLTGGYPLLPVPLNVFPNGLEAGKHPLVLAIGYLSDIRQGNLRIRQLSSANVLVPFVDRLQDGKTMFTYGHANYLDELIPTLVGGTLDGSNTIQAYFDPPHAAWKYLGPGHMSASVGEGLQPPDGPGVNGYVADATFIPTPSQAYPASTYEQLLNYKLYNKLGCGNLTSLFDYDFSQPFFVEGTVALYPPNLPETMIFDNVPGYSLSGAQIMNIFPPQSCS